MYTCIPTKYIFNDNIPWYPNWENTSLMITSLLTFCKPYFSENIGVDICMLLLNLLILYHIKYINLHLYELFTCLEFVDSHKITLTITAKWL